MQTTFTTSTWLLGIIPLCSLIVLSAINYYRFKKRNKKNKASA